MTASRRGGATLRTLPTPEPGVRPLRRSRAVGTVATLPDHDDEGVAMATDGEGIPQLRARVQQDGYRLGNGWRQEDGTYKVEAWKEGAAAFQLTPATGVGKTERDAIIDLLRTISAGR